MEALSIVIGFVQFIVLAQQTPLEMMNDMPIVKPMSATVLKGESIGLPLNGDVLVVTVGITSRSHESRLLIITQDQREGPSPNIMLPDGKRIATRGTLLSAIEIPALLRSQEPTPLAGAVSLLKAGEYVQAPDEFVVKVLSNINVRWVRLNQDVVTASDRMADHLIIACDSVHATVSAGKTYKLRFVFEVPSGSEAFKHMVAYFLWTNTEGLGLQVATAVPVTLKESMQLERPTLMAEPVKEFGKVKLPLFNP